jgi:hypothetical protein
MERTDCPSYPQPEPWWCDGGTVVLGGTDANGCALPATCERKQGATCGGEHAFVCDQGYDCRSGVCYRGIPAGEGEMCGGIAGFPCQAGLECVLHASYPDAAGACRMPCGAALGGCPADYTCDLDNDPGVPEICFSETRTGHCQPFRTTCEEIVDKVCGCNGGTYENNCWRIAFGQPLRKLGPCSQWFTAQDIPKAIPDNNATGISVPLTVTGVGSFTTVKLMISILHPYRGDLIVTLKKDGVSKVLTNRQGGSADDFSVNNEVLTGFDGLSNGVWTLTVADRAARDTGTLTSFALTFE